MEGRGGEWTLDLSASSFWQSWLRAWPTCTWLCNFLFDRRKVKIGNRSFSYLLFAKLKIGNRSFSYFLFHCCKMGKWINGSDLDLGRYGNSNMGTKKNNHTGPICFRCFESDLRWYFQWTFLKIKNVGKIKNVKKRALNKKRKKRFYIWQKRQLVIEKLFASRRETLSQLGNQLVAGWNILPARQRVERDVIRLVQTAADHAPPLRDLRVSLVTSWTMRRPSLAWFFFYPKPKHTLSTFQVNQQEAQLMLTTGSTRLAVSRGQQIWYHSTCNI